MNTEEKTRENRCRRMARRYGLNLIKSRRRDPDAIDYGLYALLDNKNGWPVNPAHGADRRVIYSWDLDDVEAYLTAPDPDEKPAQPDNVEARR